MEVRHTSATIKNNTYYYEENVLPSRSLCSFTAPKQHRRICWCGQGYHLMRESGSHNQ